MINFKQQLGNIKHRVTKGLLIVSASTIVSLAGYEGYKEYAYMPTPNDVPTIGFGSTKDVKMGDRTDPVRSLIRMKNEIENEYAAGVKRCIGDTPISQGEYAAFVLFTYNVGVHAFCTSTLVKKLKQGDYNGACRELLRWDKQKGKRMPGLTKRRRAEYKICMSGE